jgi:hypothetical protein
MPWEFSPDDHLISLPEPCCTDETTDSQPKVVSIFSTNCPTDWKSTEHGQTDDNARAHAEHFDGPISTIPCATFFHSNTRYGMVLCTQLYKNIVAVIF